MTKRNGTVKKKKFRKAGNNYNVKGCERNSVEEQTQRKNSSKYTDKRNIDDENIKVEQS